MRFGEQELSFPDVRARFGLEIEERHTLVNYGYRAAWKVRSRSAWFVVKSDHRAGFSERESLAQQNAGRAGVPVPELIGFSGDTPPTLLMRWVDGVPLNDLASAEAWRNCGAALTTAHVAPALTPLAGRWSDFILEWLNRELPYLCDERGLGAAEAKVVTRKADSLSSLMDEAEPVWLHGDCQADHFLVDPSSAGINAVVDWADAQQGDPVLDFAVLLLFGGSLDHLLDGYGASRELRRRAELLLPLYQAVRAAGSARWLDSHSYIGHGWPLDAVRRFAAG